MGKEQQIIRTFEEAENNLRGAVADLLERKISLRSLENAKKSYALD